MKKYKLSELCEITSSKRIFAKEYVEDGIPFFRSKEIIELAHKSNISDLKYISEKRFNEIKEKYSVPVKGDILLSAIGANLGVPYYVDLDYDFYFKDGNIIWFRNFSRLICSEYLYWLMNTDMFFQQFTSKSIGAAQKALTIDSLKEYEIYLPDYDTQLKQIEVLKKLDLLINNYNRINSLIDDFCEKYYNYTFVNFNPSQNNYCKKMDRFIPNNWNVESLSSTSICEIIKPGVREFDKKNYLPTSNIIKYEINDGEWIDYKNRESRANMEPIKNSIWFAKMKNSIKHLTITESDDWFVSKYILSTGFLGLKCKKEYLSYIHCFINFDYFEKVKDKLAHGSTQEAINNMDLEKIFISIAPLEYNRKFNIIVYPLIQIKMQNFKKIQELKNMMKTVLPLLMNGQVTINE